MTSISTRANIIIYAITFVLGACIYLLEMEVDGKRKYLDDLNREIRETRDSITILNAEWRFLSRPDRVYHLAETLLDLTPLKPEQIIAGDDIGKAARTRSRGDEKSDVVSWSLP